MIRIGKVVEDGQVDGEDTHGRASDGQCGHDEWDRGVGCPAEPEEADGHEGGFDAGEVQSCFGGCGEEVVSRGDLVLADAEEGCDDYAGAHGGKNGPDLLNVETVVVFKHHGDRTELEVKDSPAERDPDGEGEHNRLREEHMEWTVARLTDHVNKRCPVLITLNLPPDALDLLWTVTTTKDNTIMTSSLELLVVRVQRLCLPAQNDTSTRLTEAKVHQYDNGCRYNGMRVEDPAPGRVVYNRTRQERCQTSSEKRCCREQDHWRVAVFGVVDVADYSSDHGGEG